MTVCFVSNYINHHQIPFCNAMYRETGEQFVFIQTEPMEAERVQMGWQEKERPDYVHCYYEEETWCKQQIADCDVLLFGGCDDESYIAGRLASGKLIIRISERLYKTGQWKAVSPRGLLKKYQDHTGYRKAPVYLLCAGGYVASDFHIVRAYPNKMFCWGYFPETKHYDIEELLNAKGYTTGECCNTGGKQQTSIPYLLWAARFIDWKHPERALETARYLKEKGYVFHLDMVGGGAMEEEVKALWQSYGLEDCVSLLGYRTPEEVRALMEKADIFLMTSDRQEGWGAVANEAMNSGCVLVADHMVGAAPYLIRQNQNGYVYESGDQGMLNRIAEMVVQNRELRRQLGRRAYETIAETWNAESAAKNLMELIEKLQHDPQVSRMRKEYGSRCDTVHKVQNHALFPCAPAPIIGERRPVPPALAQLSEELSTPPLLTIIVPVYNILEYLPRCVRSITAQTYQNLEILLVDDGSTDGTGELCDELAKEDARIRVIHKENGGSSSARNLAIEQAKGEYLGFVDSDDYIEPHMYERLYASIVKYQVPIAQIGRDEIDMEGNLLPNICEPPTEAMCFGAEEFLKELLMHRGDCSFCTKLVHRSLLQEDKFPVGLLNEDFRLLVQILPKAGRLVSLPGQTYHVFYRIGSNSRKADKENFSRVFGDCVDNADMAAEIVAKDYPALKSIALRFGVFQRLEYLLHIPISQMTKEKEQYAAIVKWLRKKWPVSMCNPHLTLKNKCYHTLFAVAPRKVRELHGWLQQRKQ